MAATSMRNHTQGTENCSDTQQRLDAAFDQFWTKLLDLMQMPQVKPQAPPPQGVRNQGHGEQKDTPLKYTRTKGRHVGEPQHAPPDAIHPKQYSASLRTHTHKRSRQTSRVPHPHNSNGCPTAQKQAPYPGAWRTWRLRKSAYSPHHGLTTTRPGRDRPLATNSPWRKKHAPQSQPQAPKGPRGSDPSRRLKYLTPVHRCRELRVWQHTRSLKGALSAWSGGLPAAGIG
ncbi:Hypothetical predicted protein [Pelobates cultripes]|uniref:Uncharacterized protein n=1 Tax=Pelobates cultripes TaxID=61616 RepID=A0AAD1WDS2_PELCU|nr:Hypothetical predicted protein [Pelobates cultripes]